MTQPIIQVLEAMAEQPEQETTPGRVFAPWEHAPRSITKIAAKHVHAVAKRMARTMTASEFDMHMNIAVEIAQGLFTAEQEAPKVADTYERFVAIREGERNRAEELYFNAREHLNGLTDARISKVFRDGFDRGYDAAPSPEPAAPRAEQPCRNELMAAGKPYPRSNCQRCGSLLVTGWKCANERAEQPSELVTRRSATAAIHHVEQHNGPGRAIAAIGMLEIAEQPAPAVDEELLAALKDCAWALNWHQEHNKGRPDDSRYIERANLAIQRATSAKAPADEPAETSDAGAGEKVKKHDGPCWRQGSADCGC